MNQSKWTSMTQNEIIEMAIQAHQDLVTEYYVGHHGQIDAWTMLLLERFAKLVEEKEREACAKLFEQGDEMGEWYSYEVAKEIRARGQV